MRSDQWRWRVEGVEISSGTMIRPFDESDVIETEHAGEVLKWLANQGPIWDCLDTDERFTITIEPVQ